MAQYDLLALGECLVDVIAKEQDGKLHMEGNPGGAPANVLAMAAKLGRKTALISQVGRDRFGDFLEKHLQSAGIDTAYVMRDARHATTLAIVQLDESGNRDFTFYRDQTADVMLTKEQLPLEAIRAARILHVGSLSLTAEPVKTATYAAIQAALEAGVKISYDPNYRPPLWPCEAAAVQAMRSVLPMAHYVKVAEEELELLTGLSGEAAARQLLRQYTNLEVLAVTKGPGGSEVYTRQAHAAARAYRIDCIDTTGAGDAFWGAFLTRLLEGQEALSNLEELAAFACAAGSLTSAKKGAISAMPSRSAIESCMAAAQYL